MDICCSDRPSTCETRTNSNPVSTTNISYHNRRRALKVISRTISLDTVHPSHTRLPDSDDDRKCEFLAATNEARLLDPIEV